MAGSELSFVSIDINTNPAKLILNPTLNDACQPYELVLESTVNAVVYFKDTIIIEVTESNIQVDTDALADILEETQLPPYLEPQP